MTKMLVLAFTATFFFRDKPGVLNWFEFTNLTSLLRTIELPGEGRPDLADNTKLIQLVIELGTRHQERFVAIYQASAERTLSEADRAWLAELLRKEEDKTIALLRGVVTQSAEEGAVKAFSREAPGRRVVEFFRDPERADDKLPSDILASVCALRAEFTALARPVFPGARFHPERFSMIVGGRRASCPPVQ